MEPDYSPREYLTIIAGALALPVFSYATLYAVTASVWYDQPRELCALFTTAIMLTKVKKQFYVSGTAAKKVANKLRESRLEQLARTNT